MVCRGQGNIGSAKERAAEIKAEKKTEEKIIDRFEQLFAETKTAFRQQRSWERARRLALGQLVCLGRHTVTGMICTTGRQFQDWSADYKLFAHERFDKKALFDPVRKGMLDRIPETEPLVVAMDDSILRKRGKKTPGVAYRRDPMGPPFHTNLVRGQRVLPVGKNAGCRMIPIDFCHAPTANKPRRIDAAEKWQEYSRRQKQLNLSLQGNQRLQLLRKALDDDEPRANRPLWVTADGSFTNGKVIKNLPENTVFIGRIREDAKLHFLPQITELKGRGRTRKYGRKAPTPEEVRKDRQRPWQSVDIFATGKMHQLKYKTIAPLRWRTAGQQNLLRLIVIAPLRYRLRKGAKLLYRKPAYLICTDPNASLQSIIQAYFRRWDIEVNFRDEKTLLGVGEAQVRSPASVESAPTLAVAAYAMLLLAVESVAANKNQLSKIPPPKWRKDQPETRLSTAEIINMLRCELWGKALIQNNFSGFVNRSLQNTKPEKLMPQLDSAVLYAMN